MSLSTAPKIFPYYFNGEGFFPAIPLIASVGKNDVKMQALIDSGATISVFKHEIAQELGLTIEKGEEVILGGVGGRIKGYIHKLEVTIAGIKFLCPVVFSREYLVSFNLLGRDVFFEKFKIIFDEKKKQVVLE